MVSAAWLPSDPSSGRITAEEITYQPPPQPTASRIDSFTTAASLEAARIDSLGAVHSLEAARFDSMQAAAAAAHQEQLAQESAYLRSMTGYPHPSDPLTLPPHQHPHMQGYDDDVEEKSSANMNMGPRTWYQVPPRDLRYPDDPHLQYGLPPMVGGMKRLGEGDNGGSSQMDMMDGPSSDEDSQDTKPMIHNNHDDFPPPGTGRGKPSPTLAAQGKKTKGRVKIKMEFIDNKLRRYTTFSKRKTGIMKKAYELSTLTGTQVMLLVASETGHVYTFATRKLQPMITSDTGKALIQTCLNSPDPPSIQSSSSDQRMSATGYEETELTYNVNEDEQSKVRQMMYSTHYSHPQHHSHQLFGTSASQYPSHSPYITPHPAPSPSPSSHHHPYGVSLSPTLSHSPTHHIPSSPGPPYAPQHHSVR